MPNPAIDHPMDNVIDIFTRKPISELSDNKIIRIAPELDGLEMLYSNAQNPEKLFSVRVLAWGLRTNGEVIGLVPWLDELIACDEINDPLNGQWQGYFDQGVEELFLPLPCIRWSNLKLPLIIMIINVILSRMLSKKCPIRLAPMRFYPMMAFRPLPLKKLLVGGF